MSNTLTWKFYEIGGLFVIISVGASGVFPGISICILVEMPLEKHLLFMSLPLFQILPLSLTSERGALLHKGELGKGGRIFSCVCMNSSKFKLVVSELGEKASGWKNCTLSLVSKSLLSGHQEMTISFWSSGENGHMDWKLMGLFGCSLDFCQRFLCSYVWVGPKLTLSSPVSTVCISIERHYG